MERGNEKKELEVVKDKIAKLDNELDIAYRRIKALLKENEELKKEIRLRRDLGMPAEKELGEFIKEGLKWQRDREMKKKKGEKESQSKEVGIPLPV